MAVALRRNAMPDDDRPATAPGDEAAPGTPGSAETICPKCGGSGRLDGEPCRNCGGSGRVIEGIGGG
jgi:hypothetical protein